MQDGLAVGARDKVAPVEALESSAVFKERETPFEEEEAVFWFESRVQGKDLKYAGNPIIGIEIT